MKECLHTFLAQRFESRGLTSLVSERVAAGIYDFLAPSDSHISYHIPHYFEFELRNRSLSLLTSLIVVQIVQISPLVLRYDCNHSSVAHRHPFLKFTCLAQQLMRNHLEQAQQHPICCPILLRE